MTVRNKHPCKHKKVNWLFLCNFYVFAKFPRSVEIASGCIYNITLVFDQ